MLRRLETKPFFLAETVNKVNQFAQVLFNIITYFYNEKNVE